MKLTKSTSKNNKGWSIEVFSSTRLVKLAILIFLMSLIGTEIGVAQENKSNVQEKHSLKSEHFYNNLSFIEITVNEDEKVLLKEGNLLFITPKEDKVLEIATDISNNSIADSTKRPFKIPFSINKLGELSEKQHYFTVGLLLLADKTLDVFYNIGVGSDSLGALWPPNVNEKENSISIPHRYKGSGYIYIFAIDPSNLSDSYIVTVDEVIGSVILSNIIQQPIHFVSK